MRQAERHEDQWVTVITSSSRVLFRRNRVDPAPRPAAGPEAIRCGLDSSPTGPGGQRSHWDVDVGACLMREDSDLELPE